MPTELEYKMLLDRSPETLRKIQKHADSKAYIEQGYLDTGKGVTVRLRHCKKEKKSIWMLTTKVDTPHRVVEFEHEVLSERDARDTWEQCHRKLKKIRHYFRDKKARTWEVDIFLKEEEGDIEDRYYCILAEIEVPENTPRPEDIPDFINDHLLHLVRLRDKNFSNKRLWNSWHADRLYRQYGKQDAVQEGA